jgi:hypothetical protein
MFTSYGIDSGPKDSSSLEAINAGAERHTYGTLSMKLKGIQGNSRKSGHEERHSKLGFHWENLLNGKDSLGASHEQRIGPAGK